MAKAIQDIVIKVLKEKGPLLSGPLAEEISRMTGSQNDASRKLISRVSKAGLIKSTFPVRFGKSLLYYLEKHEGRPLAVAIQKSLVEKPPFERVFKLLLANRGYATRGQILKASGCLPDEELSRPGGRLLESETISQLQRLRLVQPIDADTEIFRAGDDFKMKMIRNASFRCVLELEQILFLEFREWLRRCYLLAWDAHQFRATATSAVSFNRSYWDLQGPTYFGPFTKSKDVTGKDKNRTAFIIAEILGYRSFSINDVDSLLFRLKNLTRIWKKVPFVPIVLAQGYSPDAFGKLKESGVVPLTLGDIFGRSIQELLRLYSGLMVADHGPTVDEFERSLELTGKVELSNDFITKLRGDLFELIVAIGYKKAGYDTRLQLVIPLPVEIHQYALDIQASKGGTAKLVECKGRKRGNKEGISEIKRHFEDRSQAAVNEYGLDLRKQFAEVSSVFITTAELDDEAKTYAARRVVKGMKCEVLDREKLLAFLSESGEPQLAKLVDKYY